ncbi:MAG: hypothetical protein CM1200mP20_13930 [Pseudomonadota bacterium]|nr:MAG: hypothetical protein CM1200mP20_13930 [Pseudomonadota bacterium]
MIAVAGGCPGGWLQISGFPEPRPLYTISAAQGPLSRKHAPDPSVHNEPSLYFGKGPIMLADLVEVTTEDGIALGGAYFAARGTPSEGGSTVFVSFMVTRGISIGHSIWPRRIPLGKRNRGALRKPARPRHGGQRRTRGPPKGYAFESVAESPLDYKAWMALLYSRGHQRLALGGHSGGAGTGRLFPVPQSV